MSSAFHFTKVFINRRPPAIAAADLLNFVDARCTRNGLEEVATAQGAHLVVMVLHHPGRWLHLSCKGHYHPLDATDYTPVIAELSHWADCVTNWINPLAGYVLRRYSGGNVVAAYALLNHGNEFESISAAETWVPVYQDWVDLLAPGVTAGDFFQALPAPVIAGGPTPTWQTPPGALPDRLSELFGWDGQLQTCTVHHPVSSGPGYRPQTGTFTDGAYHTEIRCYAHPEPQGQYDRNWG